MALCLCSAEPRYLRLISVRHTICGSCASGRHHRRFLFWQCNIDEHAPHDHDGARQLINEPLCDWYGHGRDVKQFHRTSNVEQHAHTKCKSDTAGDQLGHRRSCWDWRKWRRCKCGAGDGQCSWRTKQRESGSSHVGGWQSVGIKLGCLVVAVR